jgi:prepilin-type N-terminal cleavage/methylation domain-containing protein
MSTSNHTSSRHGFSLVELVIALSLLTLLVGSVGLVSRTTEQAFRTGAASSAVELRVSAALAAVVRELEGATRAGLTPDPTTGLGTSELTYVQAIGFDGTRVVFGNARVLRLEVEAGESIDGTDEDGDGLVDEGQIVLIEDEGLATERRRILVRSVAALLGDELANGIDDNGNGLVDEPGFIIEWRSDALEVQLTVTRATPGGLEVVSRTARTSVKLRN